jgi:drug/metabolite transporter (DMT)-like permease
MSLRPAPARRPLDATGFWLLLGLSGMFAANNLLMKLGTAGFQPVAMASMRSAIALLAVGGWMVWRGIPFRPDLWRPGLLIGAFFAAEFFLLFIALDLTTLVRAAILFYAMPLWAAVLAHLLIPGERLTALRGLGFVAGFCAVALTLLAQAGGFEAAAGGDLRGDLLALAGGLFWALILITARKSRLSAAEPETVLFWQLLVSAPLLAAAAPLYGGGWFRAVDGWQVANLLAQGLGVAGAGFLLWFWLVRRYPAGAVASFGFVTPVLSVGLAWLVLAEPVAGTTPVAVALLALGLWLINRR